MRFRVRSAQSDEIHVHGYDLSKDAPAGETVSMSFSRRHRGHLRDRARAVRTAPRRAARRSVTQAPHTRAGRLWRRRAGRTGRRGGPWPRRPRRPVDPHLAVRLVGRRGPRRVLRRARGAVEDAEARAYRDVPPAARDDEPGADQPDRRGAVLAGRGGAARAGGGERPGGHPEPPGQLRADVRLRGLLAGSGSLSYQPAVRRRAPRLQSVAGPSDGPSRRWSDATRGRPWPIRTGSDAGPRRPASSPSCGWRSSPPAGTSRATSPSPHCCTRPSRSWA